METSDVCLDSIERAMTLSSSPLARALADLGTRTGDRGTCLLIEHDDLGETLIADPRWALGRDETLRKREHFTLVDLRQEDGFRRFAVLVEPLGNEVDLDAAGCGLALSALEVTQALADIAASFAGSRKEQKMSGAGLLAQVALG